MAKDFLDKIDTDTKRSIDKQVKSSERTKPVRLRYSYYKKLKLIAAKKDISVISLVDRAVEHALEDKTIK